ncbi:MAG: recombination regulator RecX [Pseudomonadota bacterium]|jgi:regulatory protein
MTQTQSQPLSLKARAVAALARRDYSRTALARKLAPFAASEAEVEEVLQDLIAKNLLSDQRFADALSRQRARKYGAARILAELQQHGLSDEIVQSQSAQLKATEFDRALAAWQKRFGIPPQSAKERAQQMRFLYVRGFSPETFYRLEAQQFSPSDASA